MNQLPDLNLLPVFEALFRHGSVTRAAAQMGLTQSAMSSALGRLRRQLGDPLFVNTRSGMLPTPRALELAPAVTDALAMVRGALGSREAFDPRRTTRTLRVYMTDVGETVLLPKLMRHLHEHSPVIRLETAQLPASDLAVGLDTGDIDLAVGYVPQLRDKFRRSRLFEEHYVCMTRPDHPLGRRGPLTLKEFLSARHVLISSMGSGHQVLERTLAEHGVQDNVALRVPHFVVVPLIVAEHRPDRQPAEPRRRGLGAAGQGQSPSAADPDPELRRLRSTGTRAWRTTRRTGGCAARWSSCSASGRPPAGGVAHERAGPPSADPERGFARR